MENETLQHIPVDLIDDPHEPMRTQMDEEKLGELCQSIREHGLIQPITLRKQGDRYEVVAGHRRFTALRRMGMATAKAIVRDLDEIQADAQRMHENFFREDVNPVDEGRHIRLMVEKHGYDPKQLSQMTKKSVAYLQSRFDLLDFAPEIIEAVELGKIGITAAGWLQKITDENVRREYTRFAVKDGITARRAEAWFMSWQLGNLPRDPDQYVPPADIGSVEYVPLKMPCVFCGHEDVMENLAMVYTHKECHEAIKREMRKSS